MTKRNISLLSNRDMFVKYANVVEVARNSKIDIKHYGKTNCVIYGGMSGGKNQFKIMCYSNLHLKHLRIYYKIIGV